ncbi:zona pellucida sperm-binding protein 4 isoform X2 [Fundulus heteroclitus]|uniref:zona pellucida sperm-binding protein 4 isoform X2 n=1 Tax=Fundulus heteroclitus TaxID=8078 RepID=UPI00165B94FE|nr:zona pellucida sperm-binding protein 4 isoform X2 [Fundulus heteroclitus]
MKTRVKDFFWVAIVALSLLHLKPEAQVASEQRRPTFHVTATNNTLICHEDFMSVYISKGSFFHLPFSIYVEDEHSGIYQAVAVARRCHYFLGETNSFIIFTVASFGCFVKKQKSMMSLTVAIMAPADGGTPKIVQSIHLTCNRNMKDETSTFHFPDMSRKGFCTKKGFNITIPGNATVPPLNLDAVWISSDHNHKCVPHKSSPDSVTFSFPFTDCGTHSMIADGNITYSVIVKGNQHFRKGAIVRDAPFRLTVRCSFALTRMAQLGIAVQQSESYYPSVLNSTGILRAEMRFAKDSSYRSFYSTSNPPIVTELDQPVHVEVFIVKHDDVDLSLLLEDCWATPTDDPQDPLRWNLLIKGEAQTKSPTSDWGEGGSQHRLGWTSSVPALNI